MKLRFTPRAARDLADIADYIEQYDPRAAQRARAAILATLQGLVHFPHMGRRQATRGVRRVVVRRYPYLIYYSLDVAREAIVVITIQHAARERPYPDA